MNESNKQNELSESHSNSLIHFLEDGFLRADSEGFITMANVAIANIVGFDSPQALIGRHMKELYYLPEDRDKMISKLKKNGILRNYEIEIITRQKKKLWTSNNIKFLRGANNEILGTEGLIRDITKRKKIEQDLYKSRRTLTYINNAITQLIKFEELTDIFNFATKTIHDLYPDSVVMYLTIDESKRDTVLEAISGMDTKTVSKIQKVLNMKLIGSHATLKEKFRKIFKSEKLKLHKGGFVDFIDGELPDFAIKTIQKTLGIQDIYTIGLNYNEQIFGAIHLLSLNKNVEPEYEFIENLISQMTSVIYNKILTIQLQESEERLRTYINSTSDIVFTLDTQQKHTGIYGDWAEKAGMSKADFIGKTAKAIFGEKASVHEEANRQALKGEFVVYEWEAFVNGNKVYYQTALSPIKNENEISGIIGIGRDISRLKITEKNLRESNAAKDKFFNIVSHDLKSPFNTIMGFSELLSNNLHKFDRQEIQELVTSIYNSSNITYKLAENLLDWARAQTGMLKYMPNEYPINDIVQKVIDNISSNAGVKNIHIRTDIPNKLKVYCDREMFETILRNLLNNAIKYTNQNGVVRISAKKDNQMVIFAVEDNGIGIPKIMMSKLFRIEEKISTKGTNNEKGTGLGLLLCKEFIEKHEGKIWVESEIGEGTAFYFSLPATN